MTNLLPYNAVPKVEREAWLDSLPPDKLRGLVSMLLERYPDTEVLPKDARVGAEGISARTTASPGNLSIKRKREEDGAQPDGGSSAKKPTPGRQAGPSSNQAGSQAAQAHEHSTSSSRSSNTVQASPSSITPIDPALLGTGYSANSEDDLPGYEDMIVRGLTYINDPKGSAPRTLFEWMTEYVFCPMSRTMSTSI